MFSLVTSLFSSLSTLSILAITLVVVYVLKTWLQHPADYPPMPVRPLPILGHLTMLKHQPPKTLAHWKKTTGDIYSLYFGSKLHIVLSSYDILKEAFVKQADNFSDRPHTLTNDIRVDCTLGIIRASGPNWKAQRSASMSILRSFGMGKNWLAEKIGQEVEQYLEELSRLNGQAIDARPLTNSAVSNVICAILIGHRFEYDDPYFKKFIDLMNQVVIILKGTAVANYFSWLRFIPGDRFNLQKIKETDHKLLMLFSNHYIQKFKEDSEVKNFITSYFDAMKRNEESGESMSLDERNLRKVVDNLFIAGSETTSTTIIWAIAFAVCNPDIQKKVYNEIMEVIGTDRRPDMNDKLRLSYLNAYILETQRRGSIAPLSLFHNCNQTTQLAGYTIPKDAVIIPNLDAVLKDEKIWPDPLHFKPERFLDQDKNIVIPDEFVPFSLGRRICMGESLAKMELFLFLAALFQRFEILPEDPNHLPSLEPVFGITSAPAAFEVKLIDRRH